MRMTCGLLMVHLAVAAGLVHAQTFKDVQIRLGAYTTNNDGGEQPLGGWYSTGPVTIGSPATATFSWGTNCEAFGISSAGELRDDATVAWRIELTPISVVGDAVTFRMRWTRASGLRQQLDRLSFDEKSARPPSADAQLTLRPGESAPVDHVEIPAGAKTVDGRACGRTSSIRVSVDTYPQQGDERRLVAADLWMVERLPNGTDAQRSQPLSIRGLPNRPFPFYFDSIVDGNMTLDIYGDITARPGDGAMSVSVETRCRWSGAAASPAFSGPQRSVKSEVQVKPAETVEIRLPALGEAAGPFAKRALSIRIRTRQLR
jgi:hypothetical protein